MATATADIKTRAMALFDRYGAPLKPMAHRLMLERGIGFIRRTGLRVEELSRGRVRLRMPLRQNRNHIGTMYAGALYTLAEVPGGALFLSSFDTRRFYPIVTEQTIRFLKPAKGPVTVTLEMSESKIERLQEEADANGKVGFLLAAELKDENGEVVATSTAHYQLRAR